MSRPQPLVNRNAAVQLLKGQLAVAVIVPLLALIWGPTASLSAVIGAVIALAGSAYFAWQAFRFRGTAILGGFYRGLIGKFVLVIMGLVLAFRLVAPLSAYALFAGFALVQLTALLAPLWETEADDDSE